MNDRHLDNLINTIQHAGNLEIGWAGEKDHGSVRKCRAQIGDRRTDEHGVSDRSRPEKTEGLYLGRQHPLAPRMTQDRNRGDSRVAIQKMQHRASSFLDHLFLCSWCNYGIQRERNSTSATPCSSPYPCVTNRHHVLARTGSALIARPPSAWFAARLRSIAPA